MMFVIAVFDSQIMHEWNAEACHIKTDHEEIEAKI
jgi:hypothetical protein